MDAVTNLFGGLGDKMPNIDGSAIGKWLFTNLTGDLSEWTPLGIGLAIGLCLIVWVVGRTLVR